MGVALITKFILEFEMTILILNKISDQGRNFENAYFLSYLKHDFSSKIQAFVRSRCIDLQ